MTMTREEAKKMLPIIKAWAEGREIEYTDGGVWWVPPSYREELKECSYFESKNK